MEFFFSTKSDIIEVWKESGNCYCNIIECLIVITHLPTSEIAVDQPMFHCCWNKVPKASFSCFTPQLRTSSGFLLFPKFSVRFP